MNKYTQIFKNHFILDGQVSYQYLNFSDLDRTSDPKAFIKYYDRDVVDILSADYSTYQRASERAGLRLCRLTSAKFTGENKERIDLALEEAARDIANEATDRVSKFARMLPSIYDATDEDFIIGVIGSPTNFVYRVDEEDGSFIHMYMGALFYTRTEETADVSHGAEV